MNELKDRVVLITGGAGGIGTAAAKAFCDAGASVVLTDINTVAEPRDCHLFLKADAAKEKEVSGVVKRVIEQFGRVDVLINNCGVGASLDVREGRNVVCQTVLDAQSKDIDRVFAINTKSAIWFVKYAVVHMPQADSSCIISTSSIWAKGKLHQALPYTLSKAALSAASLNWAHQFAPIRSVAVVLGGIDTPMLRANPNGAREIAEQTLLRRPGSVEEVAKTFLYIATCRYVTATEIILDGGSMNR